MSEGLPAEVHPAEEPELVLTRFFVASARQVFDAWTQPRRLRRWWGPEGARLTGCDVDLRPGGSFRFVVQEADGTEHVAHGSYLELHPPFDLRFTLERDDLPGELLVTSVVIDELGAMTRMTVRQSEARTEPWAHHQLPEWLESLARLSELLE